MDKSKKSHLGGMRIRNVSEAHLTFCVALGVQRSREVIELTQPTNVHGPARSNRVLSVAQNRKQKCGSGSCTT